MAVTRTKGFLVYALCCPDTGAIRYIGRSSSGSHRPFSHWRCKQVRERQDAVHSWVRKLLRQGKQPAVWVVQEVSKQSLLDDCERFWLRHFQLLGEDLLNSWLVDPEDNTLIRRGWKHSTLTRRKIAASKRLASDPQRREVVCIETGQVWSSVHEAARCLNVSVSRVSWVLNHNGTIRGQSFQAIA